MKRPFLLILTLFSFTSLFSQWVTKTVSLTPVDSIFINTYYVIPKSEQIRAGDQVIRSLDAQHYIVRSVTNQKIPTALAIDNNWKWSPGLFNNRGTILHYPQQFILTFDAPVATLEQSRLHADRYYSYQLSTSIDSIASLWLNHPHLLWVDRARKPTEESLIRRHDLSVNDVLLAHHLYGVEYGRRTSVKEQRFNTQDLDIIEISDTTSLSAEAVTSHATDMATLIAGKGVSFLSGKGVSAGSLISTSFDNLFPEDASYFKTHQVSIQNNSYGIGVENFYGAEAVAYDEIAMALPNLLHVFSSGNAGEFTAIEGKYHGLLETSNLTGTFKQAKNVLVVGAIDSAYQVKFYSSRGPAYDGRIKPELVAYGGEGSSDAAAVVSGIASYLIAYADKNLGTTLSSDEIKNIMIASARDIGASGPDYLTGFGNVSLSNAIEVLNANWTIQGVQTGDIEYHTITLPANAANLRIALYWHDPAAPINEPESLINDLDMEVIDPNSQTWLPMIPSTYPHPDSLSSNAKPGKDHLNNAELISIDAPIPGEYQINVSSSELSTSSQAYSLAYYYEFQDELEWHYPSGSDRLESGATTLLRWNSTLATSSGDLWLAYESGDRILLEESIGLTMGYIGITLPDTTAGIHFVLDAAGSEYPSDPTFVHPIVNPGIYLNCTDELAITWPELGGAIGYEIYNPESLLTDTPISDTLIVLDPEVLTSEFLSIRPLFEGFEGFRGYALNYQQQGAGCYLTSFLVTQTEYNTVNFNILLNGASLIESMEIRKSMPGVSPYTLIEFENPTSQVTYTDAALEPGIITYQLRINLHSGEEFLSEERTIYYTDISTNILFPNPVSPSDYLSVISDVIGGTIQIVDTEGKPVIEWPIVSNIEYVPMFSLRQGFYLYRIIRDSRVFENGKILVK